MRIFSFLTLVVICLCVSKSEHASGQMTLAGGVYLQEVPDSLYTFCANGAEVEVLTRRNKALGVVVLDHDSDCDPSSPPIVSAVKMATTVRSNGSEPIFLYVTIIL